MKKQGWLGKQLKQATESVESWPDWMKANAARDESATQDKTSSDHQSSDVDKNKEAEKK